MDDLVDETLTARGPHLRLVCINDVYVLEHLPRLAGLIKRARTHDPPDELLVTLAGDFVAPSLLSSLDAGFGMVETLNAVGITHVCFGNHEDDVSPTALRERARQFRGVWLNTNVDGFEPALPRFDVRTVGGPQSRAVRVGLAGVVMNDPSVYRRVPFGSRGVRPANEAALREAERLVHDERCDCVLLLTHQSIDDDRALAKAINAHEPPLPVPLVIGGHEHGAYLELVGDTTVTKSGADAVSARVIDLYWSPEAPRDGGARPERPRVRATLERVDTYPSDPAVSDVVARHLRRTAALQDATLLTLPAGRTLSSVGTRTRQTSLGALVCSLVRDALDAEVCLFNGGGIRAGREYRERFTYADLEAEMPFDNEVVCASLPGWLLREVVAFSRSRGESGGFLQLDDQADTEGPATLSRVAGAPLDEKRSYRVALVRDFFVGLDRLEPLQRWAAQHPACVPASGSGRGVKLLVIDALARLLWRDVGGLAAIDANHEGLAQSDEIAARLRERGAAGLSAELLAALVLRALDANRDGAIDAGDLAAPPSRPPPPRKCGDID